MATHFQKISSGFGTHRLRFGLPLGVGAIRAAEYRHNSGRRFGLRRCSFQWVPGLRDAEHRFPGD